MLAWTMQKECRAPTESICVCSSLKFVIYNLTQGQRYDDKS